MNIAQAIAQAIANALGAKQREEYKPKYCRTRGCSHRFEHEGKCDAAVAVLVKAVQPSNAPLRRHGVGVKVDRSPKAVHIAAPLERRRPGWRAEAARQERRAARAAEAATE